MKTYLENCLHDCTEECTKRFDSLQNSCYNIVDISNNGFSIVPVKGSSFYSWKTFVLIVENYNLKSFFRIYTHKDNSVSVCLRVII